MYPNPRTTKDVRHLGAIDIAALRDAMRAGNIPG